MCSPCYFGIIFIAFIFIPYLRTNQFDGGITTIVIHARVVYYGSIAMNLRIDKELDTSIYLKTI